MVNPFNYDNNYAIVYQRKQRKNATFVRILNVACKKKWRKFVKRSLESSTGRNQKKFNKDLIKSRAKRAGRISSAPLLYDAFYYYTALCFFSANSKESFRRFLDGGKNDEEREKKIKVYIKL